MADQISNNVFEMISDPTGINLSLESNPRLFNKVLLRDSILNFYPWGEVFLQDKAAIILSAYTFLEGMKLSTKFGKPEETLSDGTKVGGYLIHDYAWSEDQINGTIRDSEYISGTNCFKLISNYFFNDYTSTTAYKKQISDIVKEIASNIYGISDSSKLIVDSTTNDLNNVWYQGGRLSKDFIVDTLTKNAVASSVQDSDRASFISFINCKGEFYFKSLASLYTQTPVATYETSLSLDRTTNPMVIQELSFATGGAITNKHVYQYAAWSLEDTGTPKEEIIKFADHFYKMNSATSSNAGNAVGKYPINKNNISQDNSIFNFGIYEEGDEYLLKARQSHRYLNSNIAFRIEIVIAQNANIVTGKTINLKIKKSTERDEYSAELSGPWLIMASNYQMTMNNAIYSHHVLCRPSIPFDNTYKYLGSIIS